MKIIFRLLLILGLYIITDNNSNITHHCSANTAQITTTINTCIWPVCFLFEEVSKFKLICIHRILMNRMENQSEIVREKAASKLVWMIWGCLIRQMKKKSNESKLIRQLEYYQCVYMFKIMKGEFAPVHSGYCALFQALQWRYRQPVRRLFWIIR